MCLYYQGKDSNVFLCNGKNNIKAKNHDKLSCHIFDLIDKFYPNRSTNAKIFVNNGIDIVQMTFKEIRIDEF